MESSTSPAPIVGMKFDSSKPRAYQILSDFPRAIEAVIAVGEMGAKKYNLHDWTHVVDGFNRYSDAEMRHILAEMRGELVDPESQLLHAAHHAWNALARLELLLRPKDEESNNG